MRDSVIDLMLYKLNLSKILSDFSTQIVRICLHYYEAMKTERIFYIQQLTQGSTCWLKMTVINTGHCKAAQNTFPPTKW
jgi:hypothetical protein